MTRSPIVALSKKAADASGTVQMGVIVGASVAGFVAVIIMGVIYYIYMIKHRKDNTKDMSKWMEQGGADKMPIKLSPRPGDDFAMGDMYLTTSSRIINGITNSFKLKHTSTDRDTTKDRDSADSAAISFFRPVSHIRADTMARNSMMLNRNSLTSPRTTVPHLSPNPLSLGMPPGTSTKNSTKNMTSMKDLYDTQHQLAQQQAQDDDDVYLDDTDDDDDEEDAEYITNEGDMSLGGSGDNEGSNYIASKSPRQLKGIKKQHLISTKISPRLSPRISSLFNSFGASKKSGSSSARGTGTGGATGKSPRGGPK